MARRSFCKRAKKQGFPNKLEADIEMSRIILMNEVNNRKQRSRSTLPVRSYRCEFCRQWHLTSQPKKSTPDADSAR